MEAATDAAERQRLFDRIVAAADPTIVDGGFVPADVGLDMLHGGLAEYSDGLIDDHLWHEFLRRRGAWIAPWSRADLL